jgi:hypothetical protein
MGDQKPSQHWDELRYFLAVARTGTLSAAAEQFGTQHTTVARTALERGGTMTAASG